VSDDPAAALETAFGELGSMRPDAGEAPAVAVPMAVPLAGALPMTRVVGTVPLVLLSGMLGDADLWAGVMADLRDEVPMQSERIDLDDSVAEMAASVLAAAPSRFALAGHSLGGIVALDVVRQAPERVTRLALLNTSGRGGSDAQIRSWEHLRGRVRGGGFAAVAAELARATLPPAKRDDADLVACGQAMALRIGGAGLLRQLEAQISRPDSRDRLAEIAVPVLVVSGELDEISPAALQQELVEAIPGADHAVIGGSGHMTPFEAPHEVAAHLRRWLSRGAER